MIINVTARGTTIRDSFKETLENKILSKFGKLFGEDARANATVTHEGGRETVEVTIHSDGMVFRSERTTQDRQDSLDMVIDALFTQVTKNKSKLKTRMKQSKLDSGVFDDISELEEEDSHKIVRTKQFSMKPMDVEEAMLQMELLGHNFFMFRSAQTDEISVVYKRKDGNYGLIEADIKG